MCTAIPGEILSITNGIGEVRFGGAVTRKVQLFLVPDAKVGEWVTVHTGVALQVIDQTEVQALERDLETLYGESQ